MTALPPPAEDRLLPVATLTQVRVYARLLLRRHPRALGLSLALYGLAAVAGLAGPFLLGRLVQDVRDGTSTAAVDQVALLLAGFVVAQTLLTRASRVVSFTLGERVFADLREEFLASVVGLPLSTVEAAGSGDLLNRMTGDVDSLARTVRNGLPEVLVAGVTTALTVGAAFVAGPLVALGALVVVPPLVLATRWYLRRAPAGYLRERETYSILMAGLTETAEHGRTVEALQLAPRRVARGEHDLRVVNAAEQYTLRLRSVWLPAVDVCFVAPVVATLAVGGLLLDRGLVSLASVVTVTLYVQQLVDPLDRLLSWLDELQVGAASLARLVGVGTVPPDRHASGVSPVGELLDVDDVRYAYVPGRDVLHGLDLAVRPGERLAVVGPSGAGKSTLGRLLAGIHGPGSGSVTLGAVPLLDLPLERLRTEVALVTQEHHVFTGTVAQNLLLARPDAPREALQAALAAVDWVGPGLDDAVGAGGAVLTPAQAQQVALARLVLADPHTLVLDEATSLLDPRAARHLERSLASVLDGRTVIAVAHRLHTAHDADRVAVVEDGVVSELGTHDELLALDGSYAALWHSWQADS